MAEKSRVVAASMISKTASREGLGNKSWGNQLTDPRTKRHTRDITPTGRQKVVSERFFGPYCILLSFYVFLDLFIFL